MTGGKNHVMNLGHGIEAKTPEPVSALPCDPPTTTLTPAVFDYPPHSFPPPSLLSHSAPLPPLRQPPPSPAPACPQ